jgi:hypothetical protein
LRWTCKSTISLLPNQHRDGHNLLICNTSSPRSLATSCCLLQLQCAPGLASDGADQGPASGRRSPSLMCGDTEEQKLRKSAIDLLCLVSRCSAWSAKHWNFPETSSSLPWHQPSTFECCIAPLWTAVAYKGYMIADALSAIPSRLRAVSRVIPAACSQGRSWRMINLGTPHHRRYYETLIHRSMLP